MRRIKFDIERYFCYSHFKMRRQKSGKKFCFGFLFVSFFSIFCFFSPSVYAFEFKGLQPLPPYGVLSTFSAESLKQHKVGIGFGLEKSKEPDFYRTVFHLAYGIHDRVELNFSLPYVLDWEDIDGTEDFSIGVKHRFIDESLYSPAVAYILTASIPTGREEFSTDGRVGGGLLLTKKVGPFKGHLNAFYSNPEKSGLKDEYTLNIGAELAISHNSRLLAEIVGKKDHLKNKIDLLEWRLGYRIATTENIYTTVGAGFDIKNRTPDIRLMFSVSIILPKEKKTIQKVYEE